MSTGLILTIAWCACLGVILLQQSPRIVIRVGCWLTSWGEARREMQQRHSEIYARMLAERGE